jgi:hypothetical protein
MKIIIAIIFFATLISGCKNTNSEIKEPHPGKVKALELMMPNLIKKGNERYANLFLASGCDQLLIAADKLGVVPTKVEKHKVLIHSYKGEEFVFNYKDSRCPKNRLTN